MLNDKVIKIAFIISLAGHCLLLGMPGINLSPLPVKEPEEIAIRIEIERPSILPKIDIMGEEKKLKEVMEKPKQSEPEIRPEEIIAEEPAKAPMEEKIEITDSAREAMLRYQDMIKQRIEEVRRYPYRAKRQGIEGMIDLSFIVLSNGISRDIEIVRSSGSKILDEEAVQTIKRANPFPPIPAEIKTPFIQMEVSIVFILQY